MYEYCSQPPQQSIVLNIGHHAQPFAAESNLLTSSKTNLFCIRIRNLVYLYPSQPRYTVQNGLRPLVPICLRFIQLQKCSLDTLSCRPVEGDSWNLSRTHCEITPFRLHDLLHIPQKSYVDYSQELVTGC